MLSNADIALAMELRSEGIHWHHIATGLGCDRKTVSKYVRHAEQAGYRDEAEAVCSKLRLDYVQERAAAILANGAGASAGHGAGVPGGVPEAQEWRRLGREMVGE